MRHGMGVTKQINQLEAKVNELNSMLLHCKDVLEYIMERGNQEEARLDLLVADIKKIIA